MYKYRTRADFRRYAATLNEEVATTMRKTAQDRSPQGATFLSHSSKDEELVTGAIRILHNHGASVYVDKKDPLLPPYTNKETASTLRTRIGQAGKFVLLASTNSQESKWVPWELGLADGRKSMSQIALFPAVDNAHETSWTSSEYLGLYDRIVYGSLENFEKDVWMVLNSEKNVATELSVWLKR
jgi:hypothetical protein